MVRYKITVEGGDTMVVYITEPSRSTTSFLEDLMIFKSYALEVAKVMEMGKNPTITIEEVADNG